jgi:hypothetical protein
MSGDPGPGDLLAVAAFAVAFEAPDFVAGAWSKPAQFEDGALQMPYWSPSEDVVAWEQALYEHHIIDTDSGYLGDDNVQLVARALDDPSLVADLDLPTLRRAVTFLVRAERHSGGGWYEQAFESGMAHAATRRLGELATE